MILSSILLAAMKASPLSTNRRHVRKAFWVISLVIAGIIVVAGFRQSIERRTIVVVFLNETELLFAPSVTSDRVVLGLLQKGTKAEAIEVADTLNTYFFLVRTEDGRIGWIKEGNSWVNYEDVTSPAESSSGLTDIYQRSPFHMPR